MKASKDRNKLCLVSDMVNPETLIGYNFAHSANLVHSNQKMRTIQEILKTKLGIMKIIEVKSLRKYSW